MICKDCRIAADADVPLEHDKCVGCDCQHKTRDKIWVIKNVK